MAYEDNDYDDPAGYMRPTNNGAPQYFGTVAPVAPTAPTAPTPPAAPASNAPWQPTYSTPNAQGISTFQDQNGRTRNIYTGVQPTNSGQGLTGFVPTGGLMDAPPPVSNEMTWGRTDIGWQLAPNENFSGGTPSDYNPTAFNAAWRPGSTPTPAAGTGGTGGTGGSPQQPQQPQAPGTGGDIDDNGIPQRQVPGTGGAPQPQTPGTGGPGGVIQGNNNLGMYSYNATGYNPYTAQNATYAPHLQQVADQSLVENRMAGLMDMQNPFARRAYQMALDGMNARGLGESSMGEQAAMRAVMDYAYPVAAADAGTQFTQDTTNQQLRTEANQFGAKEANTFALKNQDQLNAALQDFTRQQTAAAKDSTGNAVSVWKANLEEGLAKYLKSADETMRGIDNDAQRKNVLDGILRDMVQTGVTNGIFADNKEVTAGYLEAIAALFPDLGLEIINTAAGNASADVDGNDAGDAV